MDCPIKLDAMACSEARRFRKAGLLLTCYSFCDGPYTKMLDQCLQNGEPFRHPTMLSDTQHHAVQNADHNADQNADQL